MEYSRLLWACRRGMLELDLILGAYAKVYYQKACEEDQRLFIKLLDCQDQELFNWLVKRESAPKEFQPMVNKLLSSYQ